MNYLAVFPVTPVVRTEEVDKVEKLVESTARNKGEIIKDTKNNNIIYKILLFVNSLSRCTAST